MNKFFSHSYRADFRVKSLINWDYTRVGMIFEQMENNQNNQAVTHTQNNEDASNLRTNHKPSFFNRIHPYRRDIQFDTFIYQKNCKEKLSDEITKSQHEKIVPLHEKIVPLHEKIVPLHEKIAPLHEKIVPLHEKIVPLHEKIAPLHGKIVPLHGKIVPLHGKIVLQHEKVTLQHKKVILCHEKVILCHETIAMRLKNRITLQKILTQYQRIKEYFHKKLHKSVRCMKKTIYLCNSKLEIVFNI
jgi:hypothetical protein